MDKKQNEIWIKQRHIALSYIAVVNQRYLLCGEYCKLHLMIIFDVNSSSLKLG